MESLILKKIIELGDGRRIKYKGGSIMQKYVFYFSTKKIQNHVRVRFLFSENNISCKNVYGTFYLSDENKIIDVELHNEKNATTQDLLKIFLSFEGLDNVIIKEERC